MRDGMLLLALTGGGAAWIIHLGAAYTLIALGCPRRWPALGLQLSALTLACAMAAVATGVVALRRRRHLRDSANPGPGAETRRLLLGVGGVLAGLFALLVISGGVTALAWPPCHGVAIGGRP
jgi:hypothetical protein